MAGVVAIPLPPLQYRLLTPESQRQPRGRRRISHRDWRHRQTHPAGGIISPLRRSISTSSSRAPPVSERFRLIRHWPFETGRFATELQWQPRGKITYLTGANGKRLGQPLSPRALLSTLPPTAQGESSARDALWFLDCHSSSGVHRQLSRV
jgi:hypothetical protein